MNKKQYEDKRKNLMNEAQTFIDEGYLYFCSKDPDTGELHFSRTLQEHEQAVSIYAPLWKQYDAERGIQ